MSRRRLLVTGATGFVAGSVIAHCGQDWEVHALARRPMVGSGGPLVVHCADLRDEPALRGAFEDASPDVVIHAAAAADIDWCEREPKAAREINVGATAVLAELCRDSGARLVFTSTDTVYDGLRGLYAETDRPSPVNHYGATKLEAERRVEAHASRYVIARLSLVMGLPVLGAGNSFLARMLDAWQDGRVVRAPADEVRSPIDVVSAARALLELAAGSFTGLIHLAGADRVSRLNMARRICARMGYPETLVEAAETGADPDRAPRPPDVSLSADRARSILKTPLPGLEGGLDLVQGSAKEACP